MPTKKSENDGACKHLDTFRSLCNHDQCKGHEVPSTELLRLREVGCLRNDLFALIVDL